MANQLQRVISGVRGHLEAHVRQGTIQLVDTLRAVTPKDTTTASLSWRVTDPHEAVEIIDDNELGAFVAELRHFQEASKLYASGWTVGRGDMAVRTGVTYMVQLNEGSSRQAPAGFVQAAGYRAVFLSEQKVGVFNG